MSGVNLRVFMRLSHAELFHVSPSERDGMGWGRVPCRRLISTWKCTASYARSVKSVYTEFKVYTTLRSFIYMTRLYTSRPISWSRQTRATTCITPHRLRAVHKAKCDQQMTVVGRLLTATGHVYRRRQVLTTAADDYRNCLSHSATVDVLWLNFISREFWTKFQREYLYFGDSRNSLNVYGKNQLDKCSRWSAQTDDWFFISKQF